MEEENRLFQLADATKPRVPGYLMYKNDLQRYAQSFGLQLPAYSSVNEGVDHAPKFRASVVIDGEEYRSYETYPTQKDAEQKVARIALESIYKRIKDEACSFIDEDKLFSKSILVEFAVKLKLREPTYKTNCSVKGSNFVSCVIFDGKNYTGTPGRNKKEAEQIAARAAIQSLLAAGNSSSETLLARIIKSKIKLCPSHHMIDGSSLCHGDNVNRNLDTSAPKPSGKRKAVEQVAQDQTRNQKTFYLPTQTMEVMEESGRMVAVDKCTP